jgi:hypothetical protein
MSVTVRGHGSGSVSAASVDIAFPSGTVAADTCYIFFAGNFGYSAVPSGWNEVIAGSSGGGTPTIGGCISKILDSADIAAGHVTVNAAGSGPLTWAVISFAGNLVALRINPEFAGGSMGSNSTHDINSDTTVKTGDFCMLFAATRNWSDETFTAPGSATQLEFHPDSVGQSSCLYSYIPAADGAFTATHHTQWGGAFNEYIVVVYDAVPPGADGIRVDEARAMALVAGAAPAIRLPSARSIVVYNIPTVELDVSQFYVNVVGKAANDIAVSQFRAMAITLGRVANPAVRAWTFTLDGHDFYVLRLGDMSTLIYDFSSEQWIEWTSGDLPFWRPSSGFTWVGAQALAQNYGSSVVIGDDTYGLLWFLDPTLPYDENPDPLRTPTQLPFQRIVTGQVLAKSRQYLPCYGVFLSGDNYGLDDVEFAPGVQLETSDDQGRTWDDQGTIAVTAQPLDPSPYEWLSLGQISNPGRMFRITDNGVFARIDTLDMNDDAG